MSAVLAGASVALVPVQATELYSQVSLMSSSEPVPVLDMVNGWDGPFQSGTYAYADARVAAGFRFGEQQRWNVEWERRWHYDLTFSEGMSRYYRAQEQGTDLANTESLSLEARTLEAQGLRLGREFRQRDWSITPALAVYRVSQWQFGSLDGVAEGGASDTASAELDYHYDQDRILEYGVNPAAGWGLSLDLVGSWQIDQNWSADVALKDILNRWYFEDSGYTNACINFNSPSETVCASSATASGKSGQEVFVASLRPTLMANLAYQPLNTRIELYHHGEFTRLGAEYRWRPLAELPEIGVAAYSTAQMGLGFYGRHWNLSLASDDLRTGFARDLQLQAGASWHW